jgi:glycosyltransferase involved in cell wall biosynthesis
VVVDSGSTDGTLDIVSRFGTHLVHYPAEREYNYSLALNLGINEARNPYVLIISSHLIIEEEWATAIMLDELKEARCASVYITKDDIKGMENAGDAYGVDSYTHVEEIWNGQPLCNYCSMIKKDHWIKLKFDEEIPSCEDQLWAVIQIRDRKQTCKRISGVRLDYRNRYYNEWKEIRDTIIESTVIYPDRASFAKILRRYITVINLLVHLRAKRAKRLFKVNSLILASKFGYKLTQSRYF